MPSAPRSLAALAALLLAASASAQVAVEGTLVAPDGTPHAGALLLYESGQVGPGVVDSARTDADGRFRLAVPAPGALGVRTDRETLWLPLPVEDAGPTVGLRLTVSGTSGRLATLDGFAAESSTPGLARTMEAYVEAERWHRTPRPPEIEAMTASFDSVIAATPLDRQEAVQDSLGAAFEAAFDALTAPRAEAYGAVEEAEPLARSARALYLLDKVRVDSAAAAAVLRLVPPSSPLWAFEGADVSGVNSALMRVAYTLAPPGAPAPAPLAAYLRALAYDAPDPAVRVQAQGVLARVLEWTGDAEGARAAADRLLREFPDSRQAESVRRASGPDRRVRPGQPVPDFAYPSLADPAALVSNADFEGRVVLLDFWGTWCGPCITALPRLHALHERYRDRGFEILSVAINDTAEAVAAFREDRFPMPWHHALHPERGTYAAGADLEFTGIPAYVLVGPDGVVLAEGQGAFGDEIEAAVAAHYGSD